MALTLIVILITSALIVVSIITVLNTLTMLRLQQTAALTNRPFISILIPARNEASVIAATVRSLLDQSDHPLEVLLLDDQSTDGTAELATAAADGDPRLRVIPGQALPDAWAGKNWACHQLSQAARSEWLIFTDADVQWQPGALNAVTHAMQHTHADLLTVWPTQRTETLAERFVVPLMALVVLGYLPHIAVNRIRSAAFAAANGQCMVFRRTAYQQIGGHAAVKDSIVEDITLARKIKTAGFRLRMADGNSRITCRMYHNWPEVRNGYAKNIIAGYGDSIPALLLATVFHWLIFLFPWLWLITSTLNHNQYAVGWALSLIGLGLLVRALTAAATRQRMLDALGMPLSVLLMTIIAAQAIWWQWHYGGPRWKGRTITRRKTTRAKTHG